LGVTITLALFEAPFWIIALGQAISFTLCTIGVLIDLKRVDPIAMPTLRYWDALLAKSSIKPSAFFGLFVVNHFLLFQAPILVLNYFAGAQVVVIFTIARTLFSFVRQLTILILVAAAPEITRLMGLGEKNKLARLYLLAESITLPAILILNSAVFIASPSLIYGWMNRLDVFSTNIFLLVMIASSLMSVKEFKLYFQYATNTHAKTGIVCLLAYTAMLLLSIPAVKLFGVLGFLGLWAVTELTLIFVIYLFNEQLLNSKSSISILPSLKFIMLIISLGVSILWAQPAIPPAQFLSQWLSALSVSILFFIISYFLFDLRGALQEFRNQFINSKKG
jgi:O-antigen/teichoic acid export membrane protein